jgi:starvation-inducible DNA-binding protein
MNSLPHRTVPGLRTEDADAVVAILDTRLTSLIDLQLTIKHVHWNVVGPGFLSVHEMLDDMVGPVREMTDSAAERMRILGGSPMGTPAAVVARRSWEDYELGTDAVYVHLKALDRVFSGIISDHRQAIAELSSLDPVTEDLLIAQTAQLEEFQWFIRSFFERAHDPTDATHGRTSSATEATDERDARHASSADRPPTASENVAADRAAEQVDLRSAAEHYEEMAATGAHVKGEGQL